MTAPAVMGARAARSVTRRAIASSRSTARSAPVLWTFDSGCGSAYSMQYHDEELYLVTTNGTLAGLDVAESAVRAAEDGVLPPTVSIKAPEMSRSCRATPSKSPPAPVTAWWWSAWSATGGRACTSSPRATAANGTSNSPAAASTACAATSAACGEGQPSHAAQAARGSDDPLIRDAGPTG